MKNTATATHKLAHFNKQNMTGENGQKMRKNAIKCLHVTGRQTAFFYETARATSKGYGGRNSPSFNKN